MAAAGTIRMDVTDIVPLAEVKRVHERIDARATTGKILLEVAKG